jgi:hypothetical protein
MPVCRRNTEFSCCYLKGELCKYVRDDGPESEFRWTCTLREELGNWNLVHDDSRYKNDVKPLLEELNIKDCGEYTCENCI